MYEVSWMKYYKIEFMSLPGIHRLKYWNDILPKPVLAGSVVRLTHDTLIASLLGPSLTWKAAGKLSKFSHKFLIY